MFCEAFETGRLIGFHNKIKMRPMYSCFPPFTVSLSINLARADSAKPRRICANPMIKEEKRESRFQVKQPIKRNLLYMFREAFETGRLIGFHTKIKMRPIYSCFPPFINVFGKHARINMFVR